MALPLLGPTRQVPSHLPFSLTRISQSPPS
ncbi:hypothetical protein CCACVL1_06994 [Corchorus capsularis]|uniref:Uncharacterized protein n=1 Tax=Corchorus capsularis TaxID=210143 RepID=A0A1R3JAN7_COCAP|nr:hypothetical protein CCACVL1_06994 [Corchorus capsularis]